MTHGTGYCYSLSLYCLVYNFRVQLLPADTGCFRLTHLYCLVYYTMLGYSYCLLTLATAAAAACRCITSTWQKLDDATVFAAVGQANLQHQM